MISEALPGPTHATTTPHSGAPARFVCIERSFWAVLKQEIKVRGTRRRDLLGLDEHGVRLGVVWAAKVDEIV
jgi:hypothetical protein